MTDDLFAQLIRHEGERLFPYVDTVGKITIGVGRNLTDRGISQATSRQMLEEDVDEAVADLATFPWFARLDAVRQRVVIDMRFNLGPARFRSFKQTLAAIAAGQYQKAGTLMLQSRWATQVKGRAVTLARMLATGAVVLLILLQTAQAKTADLPGKYLCSGTEGPDHYTVRLVIAAEHDTFILQWLDANDRPVLGGLGIQDRSDLAVALLSPTGALGTALYRLSPGQLDGKWTRGDGKLDTELCRKGDRVA